MNKPLKRIIGEYGDEWLECSRSITKQHYYSYFGYEYTDFDNEEYKFYCSKKHKKSKRFVFLKIKRNY